ncbi:probable 2-oxoglutarate-dependent dioxygenase ANS [Chenopodium quinoa]|uniref:probable 2-oxoglutarate-dependent dioxygenase ANS n=1 Tax=Chenopodium quinoa TaxID=63459 RepID=UPI000B78501F|nr:probable 2-oxoglutarate-dependent dioxygenase ANS [Chenopodium quinoa]
MHFDWLLLLLAFHFIYYKYSSQQMYAFHTKYPLSHNFKLRLLHKMVVSSVPRMELELPPKPVQELITATSKEIPERFIYQLPNKEADDYSDIQYMDSNIIDLSLLNDSSSNLHELELQKLRSVLASWGGFQLINHGVSSSLLHQIREIWKEFIALPLEVKQKHCRTLDWYEGYGGDKVSEDQRYNWNDRLRFKVHPLHQRNYKIWPEFLPTFRETLEGYTMEVTRVLEVILKATAKSLNLEESSFLNACGGKDGIHMFTRFNFYPPCHSPEHVLGIKPHSDGSAVTILLQDSEVEGLQVEKDNQWFKVPIVPDALFINIGDQLEITSNGILKSVVHKVVIDKERGRTSVAMFCAPHPDKDIGPLCELIDKERPQLYNTVKNYFGDLFFQYYPKGERSISTVKL